MPAAAVILFAVIGPWVAPYSVERPVGMPFARPHADSWLGTDRLGRDVLSGLLCGGGGLLLLAAVVAVLVTTVSAVLGATAALRPRVGAIIETAGDFVILVPVVLGVLLILTGWPSGGVYGLILVALVFGTPYCAKVFAASAAGVAASGYVECARASGEGLPYLVLREVLPNLREIIAAQLGLRFVVGIYLAATASFLALPAGIGDTNWAVMVRENSSGILLNPCSVVAPGLAIAVVAVSVNLAATRLGRVRADLPASVDTGRADSVGLDDVVVPVGNSVGRLPDSRHTADPTRRDESAAVVVSGLVVRGPGARKLLGPVTFTMRTGTVTALTGPSGSGKTTLMRALLGHLPEGAIRSDGCVQVAGDNVFALDQRTLRRLRRDRIAYLPQDPGSTLPPTMRVRTVLAELARDRSASALRETLDLVGLSDEILDRRPAQLSGGQQRRVALARALLRHTEVLVLDEPLAGLHGALRTEIAQLLRDIAMRRDIAVLLSGHDTGAIHAIADRVIDLKPESARHEANTISAVELCGGHARLPVRCSEARSAVGSGASAPSSVAEFASARPDSARVTGGTASVGARESAVTARTSAPESAGASHCGARGAGVETAGAEAVPVIGGGAIAGVGAKFALVSTRGRSEAVTADMALVARGIRASVGGSAVLDGVDLDVRAGSALAVVGVSGAGKTTLARVVAGLHRAASGSLRLRGVALPVGAVHRNGHGGGGIRLVTQNPLSALNPRRTVAQTLARPLRRVGGISRGQVARRVGELLDAVELSSVLAERYPQQLSGGQRQRVALARALAADPAVLVCDEITSALDRATAASIMALLDGLRAERGLALLVISHDMGVVAEHCAEVLVLDGGRVVESGATAAILADPGHAATRKMLR
nr:ATP-binding cassette domain-containing protein [Nocardia bovistercoris]